MLGNAWEWTEDCWNDSYAGAPSDGMCAGGRRLHAARLARRFVDFGPSDLRVANRNWIAAGFRNYNLGFRVARTLAPES